MFAISRRPKREYIRAEQQAWRLVVKDFGVTSQ
jgi:hypothetical protein